MWGMTSRLLLLNCSVLCSTHVLLLSIAPGEEDGPLWYLAVGWMSLWGALGCMAQVRLNCALYKETQSLDGHEGICHTPWCLPAVKWLSQTFRGFTWNSGVKEIGWGGEASGDRSRWVCSYYFSGTRTCKVTSNSTYFVFLMSLIKGFCILFSFIQSTSSWFHGDFLLSWFLQHWFMFFLFFPPTHQFQNSLILPV